MNTPLPTSVSGKLFATGRSTLYPIGEPSPHLLRKKTSAQRIMIDVLIALCPAALGSIFFFGIRTIAVYAISVVASLLAAGACRLFKRQPITSPDMSAVVTGVLLAMGLPSNIPFWMPALGAAFGILVGKELFGGIGRNFLNPAITGRAALRLAFADTVLQNPTPAPPFGSGAVVDAVASSTPLMAIKNGQSPSGQELWQSFIGLVPGKMGETSALLLLLGAIYLLARGVINLRIPLVTLLTMAVLSFALFGAAGYFTATPAMVVGQLLGGAAMLGVLFMATDYSSSPTSPAGQVIFAVFLGINIMLWRRFSPWSEGFTFALLTANLLVPVLNYYVRPHVLGEGKRKQKA